MYNLLKLRPLWTGLEMNCKRFHTYLKPSIITCTLLGFNYEMKNMKINSIEIRFVNFGIESFMAQGDPNQNLKCLLAITLKLCMHFWPHVGKAKMRLRGVQFFWFSAVCLQFSAVCLQFFKKIVRLSNAFWLYQYGVRNA